MTDSPTDIDAILPFTPVPAARRRNDGWTPVRQCAFLIELSRHERRRFDNRLLFEACYGEPMSRFAKG